MSEIAPSGSTAPGLLGGNAAKMALGGVLAALFLYFFLRGSDLAEVGRALLRADPVFLATAFAASALGLLFRAQRWRCYLRPLKQVDLRPSFEILTIGYLFSNLLPGRVGDFIVRPLLMGRAEKIPKVAILATIAVERLFDTITVVFFFAAYLAWFAPPSLGALDLTRARTLGLALLAGCVAAVGLLALLRVASERFLRIFAGLIRGLPHRWHDRLLAHARSFAAGLNLFHHLGNAAWSVFYSLLAWVAIGVMMWAAARSIGIDVRLADGALLLGIGALGVAIPTPGGVGSFHFLMLAGLQGLGVTDRGLGQAGAILMWVCSLIPILLFGFAAMVRRGVHVADVKAVPAGEGEAG